MNTEQIVIRINDNQEKKQLQLALLKAIEIISHAIDEKNKEDIGALADTNYWISKLLQNIIET